MSSFMSDPTMYNIQTENEINIILAQSNEDLLYSLIEDNINTMYVYYNTDKPNIIVSFEDYFKQLSAIYSDTESMAAIKNKRDEVYSKCIEIICSKFDIFYNLDDIQDKYSAAYYLYDLLISSFDKNVTAFYTNYIIKEKNSLYEAFRLEELRKEKDSLTIYSKKLYKNNKIAIISANIDYVVNQMMALDISFDIILNIIYADKNISKFLQSIFIPNRDFYKTIIVPILSSPIRSIILSNIQLELQNCSMVEDMNIDSLI